MLKTLSLIFVLVAASCSPAMAKNSIAECESVANITASIAIHRDFGTSPQTILLALLDSGVPAQNAESIIYDIYYVLADKTPDQIKKATYQSCMSMDA